MRKSILLLLVSAIVLTLNAQVFVENFETPTYTVGGSIAGTNGWVGSGGGANPTIIAAGALNYADYPGQGIGNTALYLTNDGTWQLANYAAKTVVFAGNDTLKIPAAGNAFYVAMLVKIDAANRNAHSDIFALDNSTGSIQRGRIMARNNASNPSIFNLAFSKSSQSAVTSPYVTYKNNAALDEANTYLLIMKYAVVDGASNDVVSLYFNPDPTKNEASQTEVLIATDEATDLPIGQAVKISLRARGIIANIGGIRVGKTWEATVMGQVSGLKNQPSNFHSIYAAHKDIVTSAAGQLKVYSLSGSEVLSATTNGILKTNLKKGLYLVRFTNNSGIKSVSKVNIQ